MQFSCQMNGTEEKPKKLNTCSKCFFEKLETKGIKRKTSLKQLSIHPSAYFPSIRRSIGPPMSNGWRAAKMLLWKMWPSSQRILHNNYNCLECYHVAIVSFTLFLGPINTRWSSIGKYFARDSFQNYQANPSTRWMERPER